MNTQDAMEYEQQYAQHFNDALEYAEKWGITPSYYLQILPDIFHIAAHTRCHISFIRACFRADALHAEDMGTRVLYRGWQSAQDAKHPDAEWVAKKLIQ